MLNKNVLVIFIVNVVISKWHFVNYDYHHFSLYTLSMLAAVVFSYATSADQDQPALLCSLIMACTVRYSVSKLIGHPLK
jgi:hypothetical protein